MKTKALTFVEIVVVLCSLFLVALPTTTIAAGQDDYVLGVYGNANEDDTIDMRDLTYVKLIFFGKKPETELADAKYDGKINPLDFIQIKLIIVGKEKELTFKDCGHEGSISRPPEVVTVRKPINRIVASMLDSAEILRSLNAEDKIVGVTDATKGKGKVFYPELSELPSLGSSGSRLDYEAVLNLNPDVFLAFYGTSSELKEKLPGVTIIYMGLRFPEHYIKGIRKLGYILDKEEEAEEYANWHESWTDKIKSQTKGLSEDEKPRVYMEVGGLKSTYMTTPGSSRFQQMCDIGGGKNIAEDLTGVWTTVDPEWVIEQNPDIIIKTPWGISNRGYDSDDPSQLREVREEVLNRPELANVNAVKNRNVYILTTLDCDGTGCLIGDAYFAKWIHPELFEDLDPQAIHQEYLTRFQGLDYDLNEHGVFVYPPL